VHRGREPGWSAADDNKVVLWPGFDRRDPGKIGARWRDAWLAVVEDHNGQSTDADTRGEQPRIVVGLDVLESEWLLEEVPHRLKPGTPHAQVPQPLLPGLMGRAVVAEVVHDGIEALLRRIPRLSR